MTGDSLSWVDNEIREFTEELQTQNMRRFVIQSWKIEGESLSAEDAARITNLHLAALDRKKWTAASLTKWLQQTLPDQKLRDEEGLLAFVADHAAPPGGPGIRKALNALLREIQAPPQPMNRYEAEGRCWRHHCEFETLHPFTDGNGRTGRMLWIWEMRHVGFPEALTWLLPLGFLHHAYYSALREQRAC